MASRLSLQSELETLLGSTNVYFQPPSSKKMNYPVIVYKLYDINNFHADNRIYSFYNKYQVVLIHADPDNLIVKKINEYPLSNFVNFYTKDNLNYYVFEIYY